DVTFASSAAKSIATVVNGSSGTPLSVGDTLLVEVQMRDFAGRPKRHGGDFLLARLSNARLGAAVSGAVTDRGDGTYLVSFRVSWPGESRPEVALVHSSEEVAVLERVREAVPDKVSFWGTFVSGGRKERSACHVFLNATVGGGELCDFGDAERGEAWSCVRPGELPCYSLEGYSSYNKYARIFTAEERQLFSRLGSVTKEKMSRALPHWIALSNCFIPLNSIEVPTTRCVPGLGLPSPSGFYLKGAWQSTVCGARRFDTPANVTDCLRHKEVYLFGDSTIRQYWEYLNKFVKALKRFDLHKPGTHQPKLAIDNENNIILEWFCHAYPLITGSYTYKEDVRHIARRIDEMSGGSHVAVGICLGAHFTVFPLAVFRTRMRNIGEAVRRLLLRSPETRVVVKLANTRDVRNPEIFNNWSTFRMNEITLEVFRGANVAFVDAWDMTASINSAKIHPVEGIVKNQVDLFLSYIC
uniref:NXPE C-terminal domain-containing protein n=1 Tax=Petromyzon marinus TaxID=7757 RepID=S4RYX8_PETMA